MENIALLAFFFGLISAASLPMGAVTAMFWKPSERIVAGMMAFGAGALLAALTIDLVANALEEGHFYPLAAGCIIGGVAFVLLNKVVNDRGGFLRKAATTINYLKRKKAQQFKYIVKKMSRVNLFNLLPPGEIQGLVHDITSRNYKKGNIILRQGDPGDSLFIIDYGVIDIVDERADGEIIATITENDVLGEMALVTGEPRSASAVAATDVRVWIVLKEHFDRLLSVSPELAAAVKDLVGTRIDDLREKKKIPPDRYNMNLPKQRIIPIYSVPCTRGQGT